MQNSGYRNYPNDHMTKKTKKYACQTHSTTTHTKSQRVNSRGPPGALVGELVAYIHADSTRRFHNSDVCYLEYRTQPQAKS